MKKKLTIKLFQVLSISGMSVLSLFNVNAQTNVYDDVISTSPNHTYLAAAIQQEGLVGALQNPAATLTVFAPTNAAFDALAVSLNTNIAGLLALPNLSDVLLYHCLGVTVPSSAVTNGLIATPLNPANTLKLTVGTEGVFVNQAEVTAFDLTTDNGVVHVTDAVVLPVETVADVAIDNGFTSLVAAVVETRLLPALTNPFASLTVFAPNNAAFTNLATALGLDLQGLLAFPQLTEVLLYHVIGTEVLSTQLTNGNVATLNGQDVTINISGPGVLVNTSAVILADVQADNGVVHVLDAVLLPNLANLSNLSNIELVAYPNPAADNIKIIGLNEGSFELIDMKGSVVSAGNLINNEIQLSGLTNGSYVLRLKDQNTVQTVRVVKQ